MAVIRQVSSDDSKLVRVVSLLSSDGSHLSSDDGQLSDMDGQLFSDGGQLSSEETVKLLWSTVK